MTFRVFKTQLSFLLLLLMLMGSWVSADAETAYVSQTKSSTRTPGLETPPELEARVNFWKDVFAKYGKYQLIVHHRRYPQIVFKILDFSKAAQNLNPTQLEILRKRIEQQKTEEIEGFLRNLARTGEPSNSMEEYIVRQMSFLPGGTSKYSDAIDSEWVRTQTGIKERYEEAVRRTGRYLPAMETIFVRDNNLPVELTRLPFVESSFDYTAYSSVGAAGIWQFMRNTARKMMTINNYVDERLDPFVATRAAARYLSQAYKSLGSWPLAITSYNHGVAGVYKKMKEAGTNDLASVIERTSGEPVFGFASSNFYPEFLAAVEIYEDYQRYFPGLRLHPEMRVRDYRIEKPVFITQVARTLGVDKDELVSANYALLPPVASGRKLIPAGYVLRVPIEASSNIAKLDAIPAQPTVPVQPKDQSVSTVYGGITYTVRKGDTLLSIAKRYQIRVEDLKSMNGIKGNSVKVGQKLSLRSDLSAPRAPEKSVPKVQISKPAKAAKTAPSPSTQSYSVAKGDTLWSIGKKYGVSGDTIKQLNGLKSGNLKAGMKLKVPAKNS